MKRIWTGLTALVCAALLCTVALADIPATPKNVQEHVFDFTASAVLSDADMRTMTEYAERLEQQTGAIAVAVLVDFLDGQAVELYAHDLFNTWGIGDKNENNGVLLLFAMGDRDIYIYPGKGLEKQLTPGAMGQILDDYAMPKLRNGNYSGGVCDAFLELCNRVARANGAPLSGGTRTGNRSGAQDYRQESESEGGGFLGTLIMMLILWMILKNVFRPRVSRGGCFPFLLGNFLGSLGRGAYGQPRPPMSGFGGWGNLGGGVHRPGGNQWGNFGGWGGSRGGSSGGSRSGGSFGGGSGSGGGVGRKF